MNDEDLIKAVNRNVYDSYRGFNVVPVQVVRTVSTMCDVRTSTYSMKLCCFSSFFSLLRISHYFFGHKQQQQTLVVGCCW